MYPSSERRFLVTNRIAIISLFILILAGGVVRSTGSGMGCPDWPKCFDRMIPPTETSQLPNNYQEQFVQHRVAKNQRFAKSLDLLGFSDLASRIREDKSILQPEEFNAAKTWTEYVNRLIGAITGFLLLGCALFSLTYLKSRKRIFFLSLFNLFLVVFQAWLGSIVVSTNLLAWVVTIHMLVALAIVAISIYTFFQARILRDRSLLANQQAGVLRIITIIALLLTIFQITLGTEVREQIDAIADSLNYMQRSGWVQKIGFQFNIHRDLAIVVFIFNLVLLVLIRRKFIGSTYHFRYMTYIMVLIVAQISTGFILSHYALPPVAQTVHLLLASLIFGAQYYLLLLLKQNKLYKSRIVR
ncbi:COX15/CtaA family protein [Pedobacter sp. P351]|uniref:COX15/CtaA family protein n=1 Tax=Pedobacter superstes TaxID=3133441 RepID=UPI0030B298DA